LLKPVWEKALASSKTGVLDARITPTGTIWLVATYDKSQKAVRLPYRLYSDGLSYAPMQFIAGSVDPLFGEVSVGDKHIAVMGFVSTDPARTLPNVCQVELGDYRNETGIYPIIKDELPVVSETPYDRLGASRTNHPEIAFSLSLAEEAALVPSYFPALSIGEEQIGMKVREAYARANYLRYLGRYDDAIKAYQRIGKEIGNDIVVGYGAVKYDIRTAKWFKQEEQKALATGGGLVGGRRRS
jgi:hypothetical protein